jgi:hypothetical protein
MSHARFLFLLYCLRFHSAQTRQERVATNKLAPISDIFEVFVKDIIFLILT